MNTKLHFSSIKDDWATPPSFFDKVNEKYGRLKFGNSKNSAPFPSIIVVFEGK